MQNETNIFTNDGLTNIFEGGVFVNKVIGFRWEGEKSENCLIYSRTSKDKNGVYGANGFICGIKRRSKKNQSSFFPKEWTRQQIINAISEAYTTREIKNGQDFILGESANGLKIRLWVDENGKVYDAMPLRVSELVELETKPKKKKSYHKHRNFPNPKISELIWKRFRYYSRKFYFNFAKKLGFAE